MTKGMNIGGLYKGNSDNCLLRVSGIGGCSKANKDFGADGAQNKAGYLANAFCG